MIYLNDVLNGGIEWFYQDKYVEVQKGLMVIWFLDWIYVYCGRVFFDYEKIIVIGWFLYD